MAKFKMGVDVNTASNIVVARLTQDGTKANHLVDNDKGKLVNLTADSEYQLSAVEAQIEGCVVAIEPATQDGYTIGSVKTDDRMVAICDGLHATPGTGVIALGDYVVAGTPVAAGTALTTSGPRVCKATVQTIQFFSWRVISLGVAGAVDDTCVIERVC
jgi:hypothetical protein